MKRSIANVIVRALVKAARWLNRYEAGQIGGLGRRYLPQFVRDARYEVDGPTRTEIVRKALYFEANSPIVNRIADLFELYVVGPGIPIIPASSDSTFNEAATTWIEEWYQFQDLSTLQHFFTNQSLVARTWLIQGEIFILKTSGGDPKRPFPRLQYIEGHRVKSPTTTAINSSVIDGIEYDQNMRPVAYYISFTDPTGAERFERWDASNVIHVFEPTRPGQLRGLSFLYPVIVDLENMDILRILEMKYAKSVAAVTKLFKTNGGALDPEDINRADTESTSLGDRTKQVKEVLGADVETILPGEGYEQIGSERPSVASQWLYGDTETKICAGVGILKQLVFPESMQGTVARGAFEMQAAWFRARSSVLENVWKQIYVWAIGWAKLYDPRLRNAPTDWYKVSTRAPRSVVVDSGRTLTGLIAALESGLTTFEAVYAELGLDWRVNLTQRADELAFIHELAAERGISSSEIAKSAVTAVQKQIPAQATLNRIGSYVSS